MTRLALLAAALTVLLAVASRDGRARARRQWGRVTVE